MRVRRTAILYFLSGLFNIVVAETAARSQIEAALDSWSTRESTRVAILKISQHPVSLLIAISKSAREPGLRRLHAIALLGTFQTGESENALSQLSDDRDAQYRCLALHSIAELKSQKTLPVLIRKLDDHAVCMKEVSTDPAEEHSIYVSDEAVRLLVLITGQSFSQETTGAHRATKPWKEWWAKQSAGMTGRQ